MRIKIPAWNIFKAWVLDNNEFKWFVLLFKYKHYIVLVRNLWNVLSSQTIGAERKNMASGQEWQLPGAAKSLTVEEQKAVNVLVHDHESNFSENGQAESKPYYSGGFRKRCI